MLVTVMYVVSKLWTYTINAYRRRWYQRLLQEQIHKSSVVVQPILGAEDSLGLGLLDIADGDYAIHSRYRDDRTSTILSLVQHPLTLRLTEWTAYLNKEHYRCNSGEGDEGGGSGAGDPQQASSSGRCTHRHYVVLEAISEDVEQYLAHQKQIPDNMQVKVSDCITPLAWKPGPTFGILAECTLDQLLDLMLAYMDKSLIMDDMLHLHQLYSVRVEGEAGCLWHHQEDNAQATASPTSSVTTGAAPSMNPCPPRPLKTAHSSHVLHPVVESLMQSNTSSRRASNESLASRASNSPLSSLNTTPKHRAMMLQDNVSSNENLANYPDQITPSDDEDDVNVDSDIVLGDNDDRSMCHHFDMLDNNAPVMSDITDSMAGEAMAMAGLSGQNTPDLLGTPVKKQGARQARRGSNPGKPPNILIYTGKKDRQRHFDALKRLISRCIKSSCYVIYSLKHEDVMTTPWAENTALLIVASDNVYDGVDQVFLKYFQDGGILVNFVNSLDELFVTKSKPLSSSSAVLNMTYEKWMNVKVICGRYEYTDIQCILDNVTVEVKAVNSQSGHPVIIQAQHQQTQGVAVLSQVHLDKGAQQMAISPEIFAALKQCNPARYEILRDLLASIGIDTGMDPLPDLTHACLCTKTQLDSDRFIAAIQNRIKNGILKGRNLTYDFNYDTSATPIEVTESVLPISVDYAKNKTLDWFDLDTYWRCLDTKELGHCMIYVDVITTTMTLFDSLMFSMPPELGLVAVAKQQTSGKGRGGNAWLSPVGSANFSALLRLDLSSPLGQQIGYVQHLVAVALIHGIRSKPGYQDLDLRLKWPNDIYYGSTMKLGGVLVQSSVMGKTAYVNIGCGVNVTNSEPTICINDVITQHNTTHGTSLREVSVAEVVAGTLTHLELLILRYQHQLTTPPLGGATATDAAPPEGTTEAGGEQHFLELYYRYWLHTDARVQLSSHGNRWARVVGLDQHGYLEVELDVDDAADASTASTSTPPSGAATGVAGSGERVSVHSDGNSYDMMRNLIIPKR